MTRCTRSLAAIVSVIGLAGCAQVPDLSARIPGKVVTFSDTINGRRPEIDHHFDREGTYTYWFWGIHYSGDFHLAPLLAREMGNRPGIFGLKIKQHATFWQAVWREATFWIYEPRTVTVEGDVMKSLPK